MWLTLIKFFVEHKPSLRCGHFWDSGWPDSAPGYQPGSRSGLRRWHASSGHQFQYQSISYVGGSEDDFINGFLVDDIPLDRLWPFEDLFDDGTVAGVGECRESGVDCEIIKRGKD